MQSQQSQPVHVADLLATELGDFGKKSYGDLQVPSVAIILPSSTSRYPLAPPTIIKNRKRPWDKMTTITMHEELQSNSHISGRPGWASGRCSQPSEADRSFERIGHETMQIEEDTGNLIIMRQA